MGNKSSQIQSLSRIDIEKLLLLYMPICETNDEHLGRLKVYRKKQFNYDYIALIDKLVQRESIQDCRNMINLCNSYARHLSYQKQGQYRFKNQQSFDLWLKVYSCEVSLANKSNQNLMSLKICMEYLNFTLKQYIIKNSLSLLNFNQINADITVIPKHLAYILKCILAAYSDLRSLHEIHPCLNILSMISSITTPNLIYINIDGCVKFLPLPLFIFPDNYSKIDQCMVHCCQFANEEGRNNVIIPKYGVSNAMIGHGIQRLDKLFMSKFKKMVKYFHHETSLTLQNRGSQQSSQAITTNYQQSKNGHKNILYNHTRMISNQQSTKDNSKFHRRYSYWDLLQNANSVQELVQIVRKTENISQSLQFSIGQNDSIMEPPKKKKLTNREDRIKLQKYSKNKNITSNQLLKSGRDSNKTYGHDEYILKNLQKDYPCQTKILNNGTKVATGAKISQREQNKGNPCINYNINPRRLIQANDSKDLNLNLNFNFTDKNPMRPAVNTTNTTRQHVYKAAQTSREADVIWNQRLGKILL